MRSNSRTYSILLILVFMLALTFSTLDVKPVHAVGVFRAKPVASGTGDCLSWDNACTLQTALTNSVSGSGQEIWVAVGTYGATMGTDRTATFQLKNGVAVYGGFTGTETARTQRNPSANVTILSGDLYGNDNSNVAYNEPTRADNSYHVVTGADSAILDGFTITAGNASNAYPNDRGGGMGNWSSSPTLTNLTFSGNTAQYGGGISNEGSSPTLMNVTFSGNSATWGGGMGNWGSSPTLTNVTFSGNTADFYGGGMYNYYTTSPTLTNVTFSSNTADFSGGGMYNEHSSPTLTIITFSANSSQLGGGMYNYNNSTPAIRNTIFWGNTATSDGAQIENDGITSSAGISDSVVQDGCPTRSTCTTIIITTDPLLGPLGNYGGFTQTISLLAGSSAINTGNDAVCPATDQRGVSRPQGAHCDIGAFELRLFNIFLPLILR